MTTPGQLKELYKQGQNISAFLRKEMGVEHNTHEIIETSYDLQTGSYIAAMQDEKMLKHQKEYTQEIAATILSLYEPNSILEAGVGEATTLSGVLQHMQSEIHAYGFDLSWSRVAYAKKWLKSKGFNNTFLCSGDLFNIPFLDNSVDVVYTSHSIEPNGGNEEPILRELYRVARKYLILLEPGYELASDESRQRMDSHGYCKNLKGISDSLGYDVLEHKLFPYTSNPLNPTALTIIRKDNDVESPYSILACPHFKTPLREIGGMLFSPEALVVYPILGGIPCLRIENGIFASKYEEVMKTG
ncbi:MAG: methyltransferase domain-containing protein [Desulfuromonadaceae bacterium]|nr:methyltransferase domain-containing protein [Desulfuromonadaceae bacterium]MDD2853992.1 methyltransferase domain-containing protein [Desulfuromonadaceae bacterium]